MRSLVFFPALRREFGLLSEIHIYKKNSVSIKYANEPINRIFQRLLFIHFLYTINVRIFYAKIHVLTFSTLNLLLSFLSDNLFISH